MVKVKFSKIFFLVLFAASVMFGANVYAKQKESTKDEKLTRSGYLQVDFQLQPHNDTKLASALLKNVIDKALKVHKKEPYLAAKHLTFKGQDGKQMLFVSVAHPTLCLASTCKVYVLIKPGADKGWAWGFDTYAFDAYIDTNKQTSVFPRVVTKMPDNSIEYWVWHNNKYVRAQ